MRADEIKIIDNKREVENRMRKMVLKKGKLGVLVILILGLVGSVLGSMEIGSFDAGLGYKFDTSTQKLVPRPQCTGPQCQEPTPQQLEQGLEDGLYGGMDETQRKTSIELSNPVTLGDTTYTNFDPSTNELISNNGARFKLNNQQVKYLTATQDGTFDVLLEKQAFNTNVPGQYQLPGPTTGGGFPSGGGGASAGGNDMFSAALGAAQSIMGILEQVAAAIKPLQDEGSSGGTPSTYVDSTPSGTSFQLDGTQLALKEKEEKEDQRYAFVEQNDKTQTGEVTVEEGLRETLNSNTEILLASRDTQQARIYTPDEPPTTINFDPATDDDYGNSWPDSSIIDEIVYGVSLPLAEITGAAVAGSDPGQFVNLIKHDLVIGGEEITVEILKSFKFVEAAGVNLIIKDGKSKMEFQGRKTYYPRRIRESPHNMHKITNKLDIYNYFLLRNDKRGERNYLVDGKAVVSVGNKPISHPTKRGLIIARVRRSMWPL